MGQALGCIRVKESNMAVKEKYGRFDAALGAGCHWVPWCLGYNLAGKLTLGLQQLDVRCETRTENEAFVSVFASVQYRFLKVERKEEEEKAKNAFYKLIDIKAQIRAWVYDVIRETVTKLKLQDVYKQTKEIAEAVEKKLKQPMSAHGYELVQTLITGIEPDVQVKKAMNEKCLVTIMNDAKTEEAETEKIVQIKRAEGNAESKKWSGRGIALHRQEIVNGLRNSVDAITDCDSRTEGKDVMDIVHMELVTQYFETLKEIGKFSKDSHVFIVHGPDGLTEKSAEMATKLKEMCVAKQ